MNGLGGATPRDGAKQVKLLKMRDILCPVDIIADNVAAELKNDV
jgi:hypothetical protein